MAAVIVTAATYFFTTIILPELEACVNLFLSHDEPHSVCLKELIPLVMADGLNGKLSSFLDDEADVFVAQGRKLLVCGAGKLAQLVQLADVVCVAGIKTKVSGFGQLFRDGVLQNQHNQ